MKKYILTTAFALVASFAAYQTQHKIQLSDIALANVEALANTEIQPGEPCYNKSEYDANKPLAVKCDSPCHFEHLNIDFWESTSFCY